LGRSPPVSYEIKAQPVWSHSNIFDAIFMPATFCNTFCNTFTASGLAAAGLEADKGKGRAFGNLQSQCPSILKPRSLLTHIGLF